MTKLVIANWKQNKTGQEVEEWFSAFASGYKASSEKEVVICPSFPYLGLTAFLIARHNLSNVVCGAQDVSVFEGGSHTGEVGAKQIKEFCKYCIIGHSERSEKPENVAVKEQNLLKAGVRPILCLRSQTYFDRDFSQGTVPVWEDPGNISKEGKSSITSVDSVTAVIEEIVLKMGTEVGIVYGGSVDAENISSFKLPGIYGVLVGHASLDPKSFLEIINKF